MADILIPALRFGATESSTNDTLGTYSERNPFGVEFPARDMAAADLRGPSEHLRYLRSFGTWADVEHTLSGVHDTLNVGRLYLSCEYDGTAYIINGASYCVGTHQADATVFSSVAAGAAGEITVTLGGSYALPSATYRVSSSQGGYTNASGVFVRTCVVLRAMTSTTVFALRRFEGATVGTLALAHGNFSITLYGVA